MIYGKNIEKEEEIEKRFGEVKKESCDGLERRLLT